MIKKMIFYKIVFIFIFFTLILSSCNNFEKIYDLGEDGWFVIEDGDEYVCYHGLTTYYANSMGGHTKRCTIYDAGYCDYEVKESHKIREILIYPYLTTGNLENGCIYHHLGYAECADCNILYKAYYYKCKISSMECSGKCRTEEEWEEIYNEIKQNP